MYINDSKAEIKLAPDTLDGMKIIDDPTDYIPSKVDGAALHHLCKKHNIPS